MGLVTFHYCDKIPETNNLKKEVFILTHGFSHWLVDSIAMGLSTWAEQHGGRRVWQRRQLTLWQPGSREEVSRDKIYPSKPHFQ
jgi:hypothetical protein